MMPQNPLAKIPGLQAAGKDVGRATHSHLLTNLSCKPLVYAADASAADWNLASPTADAGTR